MTMIEKCSLATLLLVGFVLVGASGFQTALTTPRVRTGSSVLFYAHQNKTDSFFGDLTVPTNNGDTVPTSWGSYLNSGGSATVLDVPSINLNDYEDDEKEEDDKPDEWVQDYYEDGTPFVPMKPTLDILKSWTEEYIDGVDLAGGMTRVSVGVEDMLAQEFVYTSPNVGPLNKPDYVKFMDYYRHSGLDLASAIPDLTVHYDGWHVDPHEPWRVWVVARYSGTHTGQALVPGTDLRLTPLKQRDGQHPRQFTSGPEMQSFLWTADKKILWTTQGSVGDEYTGANQGYGGLDGLMVAMGLPHLYLDAMSPMRKMKSWFSQFQTDPGENVERAKTRYGRLPQWWNERKAYDLNIHK